MRENDDDEEEDQKTWYITLKRQINFSSFFCLYDWRFDDYSWSGKKCVIFCVNQNNSLIDLHFEKRIKQQKKRTYPGINPAPASSSRPLLLQLSYLRFNVHMHLIFDISYNAQIGCRLQKCLQTNSSKSQAFFFTRKSVSSCILRNVFINMWVSIDLVRPF